MIEDLKKYEVTIDLDNLKNNLIVEKYSPFWCKTIKDTEEKNQVFAELLKNLFSSDEDVKLKVMEVCNFQDRLEKIENHCCEEEDDCCQNQEETTEKINDEN